MKEIRQGTMWRSKTSTAEVKVQLIEGDRITYTYQNKKPKRTARLIAPHFLAYFERIYK